MVARLLATGVSSLGSNPDISQKYEMGDTNKGVANTLQLTKYAKKSIFLHNVVVLMTVKIHRT